jgi:hypothetical protein
VVIVFPAVTAAGVGEFFVCTPDFGGMVDEFTAVIAEELRNGEPFFRILYRHKRAEG